MDDTPYAPYAARPRGVVAPVGIDPTGRTGPTRGQAAGPRWRRVGLNAYVPADVDPTVPEQRILQTAAPLGGQGAVTGWAALRWAGARYFDGRHRGDPLPVPVVFGPTGAPRPRPGLLVSREPLPPGEVLASGGIRYVDPLLALFDELRVVVPGRPQQTLRQAVVALDMACAAELVSIARTRAYVAAHRRWRRTAGLGRVLDLAREESRSPQESRLRLVAHLDAGLDGLLLNTPVYDRGGRLICIPDLLDPAAGLVLEYDGGEHLKARRQSRDAFREEDCRRHGLEYARFNALDLRDTALVVERIRSARARARFAAPNRRRWTLRAPSAEEAPLSLDDRLAYRDWRSETG